MDKFILHGNAIDQDENQCDDVHQSEQGNDGILDIDVKLPPLGNTNQHPTDTELDGDDSSAVADFEDKEELYDQD